MAFLIISPTTFMSDQVPSLVLLLSICIVFSHDFDKASPEPKVSHFQHSNEGGSEGKIGEIVHC